MERNLSKQGGFTLIELMIVVAIVGILASVAIPAYQDYIQRSKLTAALSAIQSYKFGVAECMQFTGTKTGCKGGVRDIPADIAPDGGATIANVDKITTVDGVITMVSTAVYDVGGVATKMNLKLTPTVTNGVINFDITGTGCRVNSAGVKVAGSRGIDC